MDQLQPAPRVRPGKKPRHAARVPPRAPPPVPSPRVLPALRPRNEKPPRLLTEEEILERMEILSRPTTDKTEEDMLPPPLCTEGPQLSFSGVDELHERSVEGSCEFEAIPAHVRSVILNVTSITSGSEEWEVTNRQAFPDAFFSRKDLFYTVDGTNSVERTSAARSALFSKVDYRKVPRHFMDYNGFMHRYCLGFVCLVFDMRLQVIGTYDMQLGAVLPGITICPLRKVTEKVRKSASLLRIDFSALPRNVFAIAPVLFDQAGHPLPALGLSLGLSACGPDVDNWTALSERMKAFIGVRISGDTMDNKLNELIGSSAVKTVCSFESSFTFCDI